MNTLSFHETELHVIDRDGQNWLTAGEIAAALGYSDRSAITSIFARNADEFSDRMTLAVKLTAKGFGNGDSEKEVRIFSLLGAHLVAVRSHSPRQKIPPVVLDILDRTPTHHRKQHIHPPPYPPSTCAPKMLGDLKLPTAPIPPEVAKAIECRAWDLAFEAREICKQHLLRRIVYESQHNHPRHHYIDTPEALQAIARGDLGEALAYTWSSRLGTMQVLTKSHRDLAARLVADLEAVMAGGKRIGNV